MTRRARDRALQLKLAIDSAPRLPTALARATARKRDKREAPAPKPWCVVVLAVDTARRSGWALSVCGQRVDSGEVDTDTEHSPRLLARLVRWTCELAELQGVPSVLVLEAPWGGNVHIVTALGAARERWLRAWRDNRQPMGRVVSVMPNVWRGPVLGSHFVGAKRDEIRAHEQRTASVLVGRAVGPDEAPAILIARWASQAARIGKAIGVAARRASLDEWTGRVRS